MADYHINCLLQKTDNVISATVAPFKQTVKKKGPLTIEWNANGDAEFPAANFFAWKSGGPGYLPTRSEDGQTLTITYTYDASVPATWRYMITLSDGTNVNVVIDPDIHNDPPPTMTL
jgi:hypothetical protein